mmetsp:Transcript_72159/g.200145  ORF Transcript_72159/g.200145 Transcript_72159/m.200145 type:complete len:259 (+) Transcript_72159:451-1227(+)
MSIPQCKSVEAVAPMASPTRIWKPPLVSAAGVFVRNLYVTGSSAVDAYKTSSRHSPSGTSLSSAAASSQMCCCSSASLRSSRSTSLGPSAVFRVRLFKSPCKKMMVSSSSTSFRKADRSTRMRGVARHNFAAWRRVWSQYKSSLHWMTVFSICIGKCAPTKQKRTPHPISGHGLKVKPMNDFLGFGASMPTILFSKSLNIPMSPVPDWKRGPQAWMVFRLALSVVASLSNQFPPRIVLAFVPTTDLKVPFARVILSKL